MYYAGGNAIDAAVATAFALNVVEPHNSGLGGGGFMMIYLAGKEKVVALDYREQAPEHLPPTPFQETSSEQGYTAIATPGLLRGLELALAQHGRLSLAQTIGPAIELAEQGFAVSPLLAKRFKERADCLKSDPDSRQIFFQGKHPVGAGKILIQTDLARSLQTIATQGVETFYQGSIAEKLVQAMQANGGWLRADDLAQYQVKIREPIVISYHDYRIYAFPPPSSAGILLAQMFAMIAKDPLWDWGLNSWRSTHLLAETMKLGFQDRARYLGDSDFVTIPQFLTEPAYAVKKREQIAWDKAIPVSGPSTAPDTKTHTTHASFADRQGNVVAMTHSLNLAFGSCVTIPGTGILMNDHMDDFTLSASTPNAFGLTQSEVNQLEPFKRPLSSMSPTLVFHEEKPIYALGSPGGPTIITSVFQVLVNLLTHKMTLEAALVAPRIHHQYLPNELHYEAGLPAITLKKLRELGHSLKEQAPWGNVCAIALDWKRRKLHGVADPRGEGTVGISSP